LSGCDARSLRRLPIVRKTIPSIVIRRRSRIASLAQPRLELQESFTIKGPTEFAIYVPTQGASIGYTTEEGPSATWRRLYTGPILVDAPMTLRAKAIG